MRREGRQLMRLYHFSPEFIPGQYGFAFTPQFPRDYRYVADILASDLDELFGLTQRRGWEFSPVDNAIRARMFGCRRTAQGDVVVKADGSVWLLRSTGWQEMGEPTLTRPAEVVGLPYRAQRRVDDPLSQPAASKRCRSTPDPVSAPARSKPRIAWATRGRGLSRQA